MEYFILLAAATVLIAVLGWVLYRRTGDVGVLVGVAALYYWSLYGAWFIVIDKTGGFSGKSYKYLESKLFPVELDRNYLIALGLYAGFILLAELSALGALSLGRRKRLQARPRMRLVLAHEPILMIAAVAGLSSWAIIQDKLSEAWALHASAYMYTRFHTDQWFTLHQVLNRVALLPTAIGVAALAAGRGSATRCFVSRERSYTLLAYLLVLASMGVFAFVLGNKNEIFVALLTGVLAYFGMAVRPNLLKAGLVLAVGMWFLYTVDFFRGRALSGMRETVIENVDETTDVGTYVSSSNEAYGAHFSMYGVLASQVPPRFGYSIYVLACSVIPRVIWPDRPPDIYYYYAQNVGAMDNQGYSLHHATGWYLNFGYPGVALGGILLGLAWAFCLSARYRIGSRTGFLFCVYAQIAPWLFAAHLAPLLRAGPEAYKGMLVEGVLIPLGVLALACRPKRGNPRVVWTRERGWTLLGAR
jgi:hypothetical protein